MINKIIDFFAFILSKLSIVLIIVILTVIIFSRIDKLFNMDIMTDKVSFPNNKTEVVDSSGPAKIYYEGNIKPSDEQNKNVTKDEEGKIIDEIITFEILEDQSPEQVADLLKNYNLIQDKTTFINLLENANLLDGIKPGVYKVPSNIKNLDLIETITIVASQSELDARISGEKTPVEIITFTIDEDDNFEDISKILKSNNLIQDIPSFKLLLEEKNLMDEIVPGVYKVPADIKNADLINYITTEPSEEEQSSEN